MKWRNTDCTIRKNDNAEKPLLTIAFSSNYTSDQNKVFEDMLRRTSGLQYSNLEILKYENFNQFSLSEVYNRGLDDASSETILFLHNDTLFLENNWGKDLVKLMRESEYGILGLAGTNYLSGNRHQGAWFQTGGDNTLGIIIHPDGTGHIVDKWWSDKLDFIAPAVAVDGVFLLVNRCRIRARFDEDFNGFHFYDISFCIRNLQCGVKIGVITNHSIKLYHNSTGKLTPEWENDRSLFLSKYPGDFTAEVVVNTKQKSVNMINLKNREKMIHIIILTKDKLNLLFELLDSIFKTTNYENYCVWIGDTGSEESNKLLIRNKLEILNRKAITKFSTSKVNRCDNLNYFNFLDIGYYHFSKVNNEIVSFLEQKRYCLAGDFILFCNNDVKFLNCCIDGCLYEYQRISEEGINIGTLGIRLLYGNNRIQHLGIDIYQGVDNRVSVSHRFLGHSYGFIEARKPTIGNTGAFMFVQSDTFKKIGGFNELYEDVYQDVEFNLECLNHGLQNILLGNLVAYHYESQTRFKDKVKGEKSRKDWNEVLFPYIISNIHLSQHFRKTVDNNEKGIYSQVFKINFEKRISYSNKKTNDLI